MIQAKNKQLPKWLKKIKISFTFGGAINNPNSPCPGCSGCGCCIGICFKSGISGTITEHITEEEIAKNVKLVSLIDIPADKKLILIAYHNIDNGDGLLPVEDGVKFTNEINAYLGRTIILKSGLYEIMYLPEYPQGIVILDTY